MTQVLRLRASPKSQHTYKMSTAGPPEEIGRRRFRGVASTSSLDRDRDRILGWDTSDFRANPILLYNHNLHAPIGKVTEIFEAGGELLVVFELLPAGVSSVADAVYEMLKHGTLRGLSIGLQSVGDKRPNEYGGYDFRARVLELSVVSLPANQDALAARLGGKHGLGLTRAQLMAVREGIRDGFAACGINPSRLVHSAPSRPVKREPTIAEIKQAVHEGMRRAIRFHLGCLDDVEPPPPSEAWRYR